MFLEQALPGGVCWSQASRRHYKRKLKLTNNPNLRLKAGPKVGWAITLSQTQNLGETPIQHHSPKKQTIALPPPK